MSEPLAVSDASPLIVFHQIQRLELVRAVLGHVVIPPAVASEIAPSIGTPPGWVQVVQVAIDQDPPPWSSSLDPGEIATISLAMEVSANRILVDDLPARIVAERLGLPVIGSLGVLLEAYRLRYVDDIQPDLEAMLAVGFHVGRQLYEEVLELAREIDAGRGRGQ
jgi:predicted nucleic acid-binding protein